MIDDLSQQEAEAHRAARWRAYRSSTLAKVEDFSEALGFECFVEAFDQGVEAQCTTSAEVVRRAKQIAHDLGHTVTGYREAFRFLEKAVQIWAAPGERSLPGEAESREAAAEGRRGDPKAERVEAGESPGGEPRG